jgi:uncharacterized protein (TIGR01319 family)
MIEHKFNLITDIGSTTTKAILIDINEKRLIALEHADTTVEAPYNDVKIGVFRSIRAIENASSLSLLAPDSKPDKLIFNQDVQYLSTSSAGGGLQILVIGLTLFDSASSAKRAAYGAGGIILDVFAMDDHRSPIQQMLAMRNLRPDMILISGGTDGGAVSSVLRMVELLRIAKPMPKFNTSVKIPAIYAGNQSVAEMIAAMISNDFDLFVLPNLRPAMNTENLKPTQQKIQELFMENVMERAPGYKALKSIVSAPILPTPGGVLNTLELLESQTSKNLILFDIGGATTDVFTRINTHFQRTVSANLGMSYSALNVLKESELQQITKMLPESINEQRVRNYIGNKTLYPTRNPQSREEYQIEHAIAKNAIRLSFQHHQQMHYNTEKLGYLDALKSNGKDKYEEKFEYIANEQSYYFYPSDIDLIIGAGGVFAHAQNPMQCIQILVAGFKPLGVTELAIDERFISPHLGVFAQSNRDLAKHILHSDCIKSLAMYIRPIFPQKKGLEVLKIVDLAGKTLSIKTDSIEYLPPQKGARYIISAAKKCMIDGDKSDYEFETDLPVIIDTRFDPEEYDPRLERLMNAYQQDNEAVDFSNQSLPFAGNFTYDVELPYSGDILKLAGDSVSPDEEVAVNRYNPPRLFVVNTCNSSSVLPTEEIRNAFAIDKGDEVNFSQLMRRELPQFNLHTAHYSPVHGKVEFIDYKNGIVVLSEVQRYSDKPVKINIADKLGILPKRAHRYLQKSIGEFVYEGDMLAKLIATDHIQFAASPSTGQIVDYDKKTAVMTISYKSRPHYYKAHVQGIVEEVKESKAIRISYRSKRLEAAIGWGKPSHGKLLSFPTNDFSTAGAETIAVLGFKPSFQDLLALKDTVKGIICSSIDESELIRYLGFEQGVVNTGQEDIPAALILVQGFGDMAYNQAQKEYFLANVGKHCMIDPHTRIRAGVVRASINIMD